MLVGACINEISRSILCLVIVPIIMEYDLATKEKIQVYDIYSSLAIVNDLGFQPHCKLIMGRLLYSCNLIHGADQVR